MACGTVHMLSANQSSIARMLQLLHREKLQESTTTNDCHSSTSWQQCCLLPNCHKAPAQRYSSKNTRPTESQDTQSTPAPEDSIVVPPVIKKYKADTSAGDLDAASTSISIFPSLNQETEEGEVPEIMEDERGSITD